MQITEDTDALNPGEEKQISGTSLQRIAPPFSDVISVCYEPGDHTNIALIHRMDKADVVHQNVDHSAARFETDEIKDLDHSADCVGTKGMCYDTGSEVGSPVLTALDDMEGHSNSIHTKATLPLCDKIKDLNQSDKHSSTVVILNDNIDENGALPDHHLSVDHQSTIVGFETEESNCCAHQNTALLAGDEDEVNHVTVGNNIELPVAVRTEHCQYNVGHSTVLLLSEETADIHEIGKVCTPLSVGNETGDCHHSAVTIATLPDETEDCQQNTEQPVCDRSEWQENIVQNITSATLQVSGQTEVWHYSNSDSMQLPDYHQSVDHNSAVPVGDGIEECNCSVTVDHNTLHPISDGTEDCHCHNNTVRPGCDETEAGQLSVDDNIELPLNIKTEDYSVGRTTAQSSSDGTDNCQEESHQSVDHNSALPDSEETLKCHQSVDHNIALPDCEETEECYPSVDYKIALSKNEKTEECQYSVDHKIALPGNEEPKGADQHVLNTALPDCEETGECHSSIDYKIAHPDNEKTEECQYSVDHKIALPGNEEPKGADQHVHNTALPDCEETEECHSSIDYKIALSKNEKTEECQYSVDHKIALPGNEEPKGADQHVHNTALPDCEETEECHPSVDYKIARPNNEKTEECHKSIDHRSIENSALRGGDSFEDCHSSVGHKNTVSISAEHQEYVNHNGKPSFIDVIEDFHSDIDYNNKVTVSANSTIPNSRNFRTHQPCQQRDTDGLCGETKKCYHTTINTAEENDEPVQPFIAGSDSANNIHVETRFQDLETEKVPPVKQCNDKTFMLTASRMLEPRITLTPSFDGLKCSNSTVSCETNELKLKSIDCQQYIGHEETGHLGLDMRETTKDLQSQNCIFSENDVALNNSEKELKISGNMDSMYKSPNKLEINTSTLFGAHSCSNQYFNSAVYSNLTNQVVLHFNRNVWHSENLTKPDLFMKDVVNEKFDFMDKQLLGKMEKSAGCTAICGQKHKILSDVPSSEPDIPFKVRVIEQTQSVKSRDQTVPCLGCNFQNDQIYPEEETLSLDDNITAMQFQEVSQKALFSWTGKQFQTNNQCDNKSKSCDDTQEDCLSALLPLKTCNKPRRVGLSRRQKLQPLHHVHRQTSWM